MAKTYPKQALRVFAPNDATLGAVSEYFLEGATQTFLENSPVVMTGGYIVAAADPVTAVFGIVLEDAHNDLADGTHKVRLVPVNQQVGIYANFLGAGAANNVLAAADLGLDRDLEYDANALGTGLPGYYVQDSAASAAVNIFSFNNDWPYPNSIESIAVAGDTNARISAVFLNSVVQPFA